VSDGVWDIGCKRSGGLNVSATDLGSGPGWCGLRFAWRWTTRARRGGAGSVKRFGLWLCRSRPPRTWQFQANSGDAWRRRWNRCQKSRGWFFCCLQWMAIHSKKWQSCFRFRSAR